MGVTAFERFKAIAESLGGPAKKSGKWLRVSHPCSDSKDGSKSLAFMETPDGKVMVASHKSYSTEDVLRVMGLEWGDLFPDDSRTMPRNVTRQYEYITSKGDMVGAVQRTSSKDFFQGHYEGESLLPGLNGKPLPIYMEPMVKGAIQEGRTIYVCEGEKDVEACWRVGIPATTKPGGAKSGWLPNHIAALEGATVTIVADKDKPGRECAIATYEALKGHCALYGIVEAKQGKDIYDHLSAGLSVEDLVRRDDLVPGRGLRTVSFNGDFKEVVTDYLIAPYLPKGKTVLVDAEGGAGKTSWLLSMAAALSNGTSPIGHFEGQPVRTLYLFQDADLAEEYETVYRANEGAPGMIEYIQTSEALTPQYADKIIETIEDGKFGMVVFDPFFYFLLGLAKDTNKAFDVLPICHTCNRIAYTTGATCIAVRHTAKGSIGKQVSELGMGSVQFRNSFRGQLVMRWHEDRHGVVNVTDEKGSLLVPKGRPFSFMRNGNRVEYLPYEGPKKDSKKKPVPYYLADDFKDDPFNEP